MNRREAVGGDESVSEREMFDEPRQREGLMCIPLSPSDK